MNVWMKSVAVSAMVACSCAAQTGTPSSPPPAAPPAAAPGAAPPNSPGSEGTGATPAPPPAVAAQPLTVPTPPPVKKTDADPGAAAAPEPAAVGPTSNTAANVYVIGTLDVISIRVWGQPNLTGLVSVRDDGMISMQLIGEVKADGLTCEQLRLIITKRLSDYLNNPTVSVDLAKNNSKKFYITGEGANHSGPFPLNGKVTIFEALTSAGGFSSFANQKKIYLLRKGENGKKHYFNYKDALSGKHPEQDIEVQNGDIIVVP
jgi:polysaccharide export outer membrane protein